jgi:3-hydroxyacyl-CoA dehydrogenase / enoyl-CoA hydratase / 3-hydroxybutyryl-CoA epimerase
MTMQTTRNSMTEESNREEKAFTFTLHEDGIGVLTFDLPKEKVNKLTFRVMKEFSDTLTLLRKEEKLKLLMIKSGKKNIFIAGADISEISSITTQEDGESKAALGQEVLNLLDDMPIPTVCVIDGACLGGGLELALACDFRIVTDNPKVKLGLPEVNLGIIPGFGGTQRLPRLIGLQKSLPLILTGKPVDGKKALKLGLADLCLSNAFVNEGAMKGAKDLLSSSYRNKLKEKRKPKGLLHLLLESNPIGESIIFKQTRKTVMKKTKGEYPAPLAAIRSVKKGMKMSLKKGLKYEVREFGKLACSQICKELIQLYYTNEDLKKDLGVEKENPEIKPIDSTVVLGAGLMGGGIAWLFADKGISVRLKDIHWDALAKGLESAQKIYDKLIKIRKTTPREANLKMLHISPTVEETGLKNRDLLIEAIVEDMGIKKEVLKGVEQKVSDDCIICSNTSSLSITEMASDLKRPENFIGMHFFSPVNRMPLVEIIPGEKTSEDTIATVVALSKRLKKTPIVVKNCAGFLVNRILIPYVNEAVYLLQDGVDIALIDSLAEKYGMPLGPLALADEVGLDVGYKVAKLLEDAYGKRMKTAGLFYELNKNENLLGKKSGKGFYEHKSKGKKVNSQVEKIVNTFRLNHSQHHFVSQKEALDRLMLIMVNEAARCVEEKIVANHKYLDMAMIMGTGFPPFRGGILRYADSLGIDYVTLNLNNLSHKFGERFQPAPLLLKMAENNETFYKD